MIAQYRDRLNDENCRGLHTEREGEGAEGCRAHALRRAPEEELTGFCGDVAMAVEKNLDFEISAGHGVP